MGSSSSNRRTESQPSNLVGLAVFCNEGERSRPVLEALKKAAPRLVVIHDGPPNEETRKLCEELADRFIVYEKAGCKEPQLARYFGFDREGDEWFIHVDSDQVLSNHLISEILQLELSEPEIFDARFTHFLKNGRELKYKLGSPRNYRFLLFHLATIQSIIGVTHKGITFKTMVRRTFQNEVMHLAPHLEFGWLTQAKREIKFAKTDAGLRNRNIAVYRDGKLENISPISNFFSLIDRLRNRLPLVFLIPALFYRIFQSFIWMSHSRSISTVAFELKQTMARLVYQTILLTQLYKLKK